MEKQEWLDRYLEAWATHFDGTPEATSRMIDAVAEDFRLEDLPSGGVYEGADGIRNLNSMSSGLGAGVRMQEQSRISQGSQVAITWALQGSLPNGTTVDVPGVSIFELDEVGKPKVQKDYWNLASLVALMS